MNLRERAHWFTLHLLRALGIFIRVVAVIFAFPKLTDLLRITNYQWLPNWIVFPCVILFAVGYLISKVALRSIQLQRERIEEIDILRLNSDNSGLKLIYSSAPEDARAMRDWWTKTRPKYKRQRYNFEEIMGLLSWYATEFCTPQREAEHILENFDAKVIERTYTSDRKIADRKVEFRTSLIKDIVRTPEHVFIIMGGQAGGFIIPLKKIKEGNVDQFLDSLKEDGPRLSPG